MSIADHIIRLVAQQAGITQKRLRSRSRERDAVHARLVAAWLLRRHTNLSNTAIGRALNRDHSTVVHAIRRVRELLQRDADGEPLVRSEHELVALARRCEHRCRLWPLRREEYGVPSGVVPVPLDVLLVLMGAFVVSRMPPMPVSALPANKTCAGADQQVPIRPDGLTIEHVRQAVLHAFRAPPEAVEPRASHGSWARWAGVRSAYVWLVRQHLAAGSARRAAELCGISERAVREAGRRVQDALHNDVFERRLRMAEQAMEIYRNRRKSCLA